MSRQNTSKNSRHGKNKKKPNICTDLPCTLYNLQQVFLFSIYIVISQTTAAPNAIFTLTRGINAHVARTNKLAARPSCIIILGSLRKPRRQRQRERH